jgi:bacteriocin-like protein
MEKLARQQLQQLRIRQLTDSELDQVSGGFSHQGAQGQQGSNSQGSNSQGGIGAQGQQGGNGQ